MYRLDFNLEFNLNTLTINLIPTLPHIRIGVLLWPAVLSVQPCYVLQIDAEVTLQDLQMVYYQFVGAGCLVADGGLVL